MTDVACDEDAGDAGLERIWRTLAEAACGFFDGSPVLFANVVNLDYRTPQFS
jgi:hypothetical protein